MGGAHEFLKALTVVLGVAAAVTVLFQRLRQPVVLGYIIAGLLVGPHMPFQLVASKESVETLSELGVILLMFSIGLDFSVRRLAQVGPTAGITALVESSFMVWLGFSAGRLLGWTTLECLFAGASVAISSTTIIAKAFDEQGIKGPLREFVIGVLVVEDLIAILLIATLTALSSGAGLSAGNLAAMTGRLVAFLVALVAIGLLVIPRAMRAIVRLGRPETILVSTVAVCFGVSLLAQAVGYSVALGAFIAGSLVCESGEGEAIEQLILPVRDMFAAIFFVSVGMTINPALITHDWAAVLVLTAVVIVGKITGVALGAFLTGNGPRTSVQAGMSLAQIGEFSFIIAGLGIALGATGNFLYPVAVSVSVLTTFSTPWLIRASGAAASAIDRRLPRPIQTFATLYGTWIERLRNAPRQKTRGAVVRRLFRLLLLDGLILAAIAIGVGVSFERLIHMLQERLRFDPSVLRWIVILLSVAAAIPFLAGIVRVAGKLGVVLSEAAFPRVADRPDLGLAPRRLLAITLQLTFVLLIGGPLVTLTQPFFSGAKGAVALALLLLALAIGFWRSATDFQGHVRAAAQVIAEAIGTQARSGKQPATDAPRPSISELLPGLGEPVPVALADSSPAVGRTLAELNLRGLTGAIVLAIRRGSSDVLLPAGTETLQAGDVVAIVGVDDAVQAAKLLLQGAP